MSEATLNGETFPFMESVATVVADESRKGLDAFKRIVREYEAATATHGPVVPISTVAEHLDVSHQAVQNLIERNRLEAVEIGGRRWVVGVSVLRYLAEGPRRTGRPKKLSKVANSIRLGKELAASAEGVMGN